MSLITTKEARPDVLSLKRSIGNVFGIPIDIISWDQAVDSISTWALTRESKVVCICNAHSVVTARQDPEFSQVIFNADLATPDGAPVAWLLRRLGARDQQRINGPDLMWKYCAHAADCGEAIYLYGSSEATLSILKDRLMAAFPALRIAGSYSPPFRPLTAEEDETAVKAINDSNAGVVWVSLGCPKQEKWMDEHRGRINAVMVGVGAAFDYHAGTIQRAPLWMQRNGLEWLHRFASEPRRLWKRYLVTNTLFIWYSMQQILFNRVPNAK
ncbi:WecB/TagA/CpsF family glycosyltransferase [Hydrogenophaga sp. PAMC20947]|uniref:WecB/TagA/CpsF family glycosyltransferase n=1 Tax=Hydrogenophaga sp. PAMC20947 TaxID=2565558 RepID=UPI00109E144F|nr:WecB/TagA/CpsF family glycosyltransferase [Hydrogenophaga sp. PAMC20947]QCB47782.1 glycosyltransferase [Hydrogenophaga sp. PAMC20947]